MAESDTRLETLEDEVKVLKGEVKRTLVDLRALLMREDSPLAEGEVTRRAAMPDQSLGNGTMKNGAARETSQPLSPEGSSGDTGSIPEDRSPAPDLGLPSDDLPGAPPQTGPGPISVVLPGAISTNSTDRHDDSDQDQASSTAESSKASLSQANGQAGKGTGRKGKDSRTEGAPASPRSRVRSRKSLSEDAPESDGPEPANQNGRAASVYDEYRELLEETEQTHEIEDSPVGPPLDINLLSNLVYWTALAKQRVGEGQLKDILRLYIQSGHSRPELQDLLLQVAEMVDASPFEGGEMPHEWVDLMFQLHGILTGGFPVIKLPQIRLSSRDNDEGDHS